MNSRLWKLPLALLAAVALVATACSVEEGILGSGQGKVRIVMSAGAEGVAASTADVLDDDPNEHHAYRMLKSAVVTFSSVLARNLNGQLIDVNIELPVTVDVLSLVDERTVELPEGFLPPDTYDQMVVVMTRLELITMNDTGIDITPPGGGWTAVVNACDFTVAEGATTTVQLRFRHRHSFRHHDRGFLFRPSFECQEPMT